MKDVVYAGFAQLSYLNWHNLEKKFLGNKLKIIFDSQVAFEQIRTSDYINMEREGSDYFLKKENGKKIYDAGDSRFFYLYSEHPVDSDTYRKYSSTTDNPKKIEEMKKLEKEGKKIPILETDFGEWHFEFAYDHHKICDEDKKFKNTFVKCGFQCSIFSFGKNVMIAIRGSNTPTTDIGDWRTNYTIAMKELPLAIECIVWVFENKIKTKFIGYNIHVTGHSMGAALAQYLGVYAHRKDRSIKVVTWNGLGMGKKEDIVISKESPQHLIDFHNNYDSLKNSSSIMNYNISKDIVGNLKKKIGKVRNIDVGTEINDDIIEMVLSTYGNYSQWDKYYKNIPTNGNTIVFKSMYVMGKMSLTIFSLIKPIKVIYEDKEAGIYHSMNNFMPFFHEGMIMPNFINDNFTANSYKQIYLNYSKLYFDLKELKLSGDKKESCGNLYCYCNDISHSESYHNWAINLVSDYKREEMVQIDNYGWLRMKKIGLFNNMHVIAGITGGAPGAIKEHEAYATKKVEKFFLIKNGRNTVKYKYE